MKTTIAQLVDMGKVTAVNVLKAQQKANLQAWIGSLGKLPKRMRKEALVRKAMELVSIDKDLHAVVVTAIKEAR